MSASISRSFGRGSTFNNAWRVGRSHISAYDYGLFPVRSSNRYIPQDMGFRAESALSDAGRAARDFVINNGTLMNRAYDFDTGELLSFSGQIHNCFARPNKLRRIDLLVNKYKFSLPELKAQLKFMPGSSGRHLNDLLTVMEREAVTLYKWNAANIVVHHLTWAQTNFIPYLQLKGKQFSQVCHHRRYTIKIRFTKRVDEPMRLYETHAVRPLEGESMREFVERRDKDQAYRWLTTPIGSKERPWVYPMADLYDGWGTSNPHARLPRAHTPAMWVRNGQLAYKSSAPF